MSRWFFLAPLLLVLGCTKPNLATTLVQASTAEELAAFRADLAQRFPADQLATLDTALNELQLAGMDQGLNSATERAAAMRSTVNGKSVRAVEILGFEARRTRFLGEIKLLTEMRDRDVALRDKTATTGTPRAVLDRIASAEEVLSKLRRHLEETERQLSALGAEKPSAPTPPA